jgi:hypothetical protein
MSNPNEGEEVQITKRKRVIARLVPERPAPPVALPDFMAMLKEIYGNKKLKVTGPTSFEPIGTGIEFLLGFQPSGLVVHAECALRFSTAVRAASRRAFPAVRTRTTAGRLSDPNFAILDSPSTTGSWTSSTARPCI